MHAIKPTYYNTFTCTQIYNIYKHSNFQKKNWLLSCIACWLQLYYTRFGKIHKITKTNASLPARMKIIKLHEHTNFFLKITYHTFIHHNRNCNCIVVSANITVWTASLFHFNMIHIPRKPFNKTQFMLFLYIYYLSLSIYLFWIFIFVWNDIMFTHAHLLHFQQNRYKNNGNCRPQSQAVSESIHQSITPLFPFQANRWWSIVSRRRWWWWWGN